MAKGNAPVQAREQDEAVPPRSTAADKRASADQGTLDTLLGYFAGYENLADVSVSDGQATVVLTEADEDMMWPDRINDVPVTFEILAAS